MSNPRDSGSPSTLAIEPYQAGPDVLYSLDAAARLAGVPRRSLLVYCRAGLVQPVALPPYGAMAFTVEAIHTVRQIEGIRAARGVDLAWIKAMFDLLAEVERLRDQVRFLRDQ